MIISALLCYRERIGVAENRRLSRRGALALKHPLPFYSRADFLVFLTYLFSLSCADGTHAGSYDISLFKVGSIFSLHVIDHAREDSNYSGGGVVSLCSGNGRFEICNDLFRIGGGKYGGAGNDDIAT